MAISTLELTVESIGQKCKLLPLKGNLVYEYNPLKVFRIATSGDSELGENDLPYSLLDLNTSKLTFDLKHPVDMVLQPSYDGSVNIILNDDLHPPRLINSRFSVTGMGTYLIVDREGDNDTNIYNKESFDTDISLYKRATTIAKLKFLGVSSGGKLPVGNYHFYFKLSDADGNETDFIAESGLVSCFIGNTNDPFSILGGIRDLNSFKAVHFNLSNLDSSYTNVVVYYTRSTSDNLANVTTNAYKILKNFPIYNKSSEIRINGFEEFIAVSINDINQLFNIVESAKTQEVAQNMLFMGNVNKNEIPYKELSDLSLRFYATLDTNSNIGNVKHDYKDSTGGYEYYNVDNIYNKLGYWNDEIYRFGVVYIMKDYTLSPVFNIRGTTYIGSGSSSYLFGDNDSIYNNNGIRNYIPIDKQFFSINGNDNSKGVVRIKSEEVLFSSNGTKPIGIKINTYDGENLISALKEYTIGCIFVRQKRIATTLCQGVTIGIERNSHLPTIPISNSEYIMESFLTESRVLSHNFNERKRLINSSLINKGAAMICPEYELNAPFYNLFFTGAPFTIKLSINNFTTLSCSNSDTHFYNENLNTSARSNISSDLYKIVSLQDGLALAKNYNLLYSAMAGTAEEVFRVSYIEYKNTGKNATNIVRGIFGPYIGLEKEVPTEDQDMDILDIKIPNYSESNMHEYYLIRYLDTSPFMPISERLEWKDLSYTGGNYYTICFRGDCYICNFTHRMIRNFSDPSAPYNDDFVKQNTWKDDMDLADAETYEKTNRGDVNAVKIGHWITVKVCSNLNLSLRSVDHSWAAEEGITNKPRAFYPLYAMNTSGENKVPESNVYNDGYTISLSSKYNYETPNVPAIKNVFTTRVMYSDIAINDAFRNGFRVFNLTHYRDYTLTYGALIRLIELKGNLVAVFEHGVCLIPVNERAIAASGAGGNVFINTSSVLPDNPLVLSDMYGSQWSESIVKTPYYIYGLDTVGKKIWRTNGLNFDIISDFRVQKFLIDNISITEKETLPIIGIRNVKTHYNAYKSDVMFTFYDDINTIEEKVWNLCYNEISQTFTTLYSWVPSYSVNIDNIMFSFDRSTSRKIAKCSRLYPQLYLEPSSLEIITDVQYLGWHKLGTVKLRSDDHYIIELYNDNTNNHNKYDIDELGNWYVNDLAYNQFDDFTVAVKATMLVNGEDGLSKFVGGVVYGTVTCMKSSKSLPTTSFWKHGQGGLVPTNQPIKPCMWYGELHPFEFEFVVVDNPQTHKIFDNLSLVSNKALPESFHFDVVGEVYDFTNDKLNMYCRLEATKLLYQRLGSDIKYNPNYIALNPKLRPIIGTSYYLKSTIFPLYYRKVDSLETIYNCYTMMQDNSSVPRDYRHLSGSEIIYDPLLSEFRIATHIGAWPVGSYYDRKISQEEYESIIALSSPLQRRVYTWIEDNGDTSYYERIYYGYLRGNCRYLEDKWIVQIPSITFMLKNESKWSRPPIVIDPDKIPSDIISTKVNSSALPDGYTFADIDVLPNTFDRGNGVPTGWTNRKETKIRDKYIRIRIRYKGDELAVITAIKTLYTESYA